AESRQFTDRLDSMSVDAEAGQGVRTAASDVLVVKHGYPERADDLGARDNRWAAADTSEEDMSPADDAEVTTDPDPSGQPPNPELADDPNAADPELTDDPDARSEAGH